MEVKYGQLLSNFAFNFNMRPSMAAAGDHAAAAASLERSLELHVKVGGMASRGVAAAVRALAVERWGGAC